MPRDKNIFTLNPTSIDMKRSVFNRNSQHKTSFNLGQIIPLYLDEILPGDTVSLDLAQVIRMGTPIAPIMDNLYCDVYAFFIPNRLVWSHWQQFCGENDTGAWTQTTSYSVPRTNVGNGSNTNKLIGSLADYFGLPLNNSQYRANTGSLANNVYVSELPLRAYYKVINDWFIDENNVGPVVYSIGDNANSANVINYADAPYQAARFHDLFSSCLPAPQKGGSVVIPLGVEAPLKANSNSYGLGAQMYFGSGSVQKTGTLQLNANAVEVASGTIGTGDGIDRTNLYADLSNATAATINQLRYAFQVQKLLEKDARGGTRYIELLKAHFGVTSPDARLQRSEYLAGHRFRINVDQVLSTADSGASGSSDLGETGAFSKTVNAGSFFTKSFVEHGMLMIVGVIRQDHTYSTGIEKYWTKKDRFDFYYPVLANIGEVPVYKSELHARGGTDAGVDSGVFGYNEAWYEYRFKPSRCSGYMNPAVKSSLNYWTLGDVFDAVPGLNANFIQETPSFLDRALKVQSSTMHQFIADFYFKAKFSRVMPLYSIPGLIDHH